MNDEEWLARARESLDERSEAIDGYTQSRLTRARAAAIEQSGRQRRSAARLVPLTACAVVAAMLIPGLLGEGSKPEAPQTALTITSDLELLAAEEDFALLADLDFYLWLESELPAIDQG